MKELLEKLFPEPEYHKLFCGFASAICVEAQQKGVSDTVTDVFEELGKTAYDANELLFVQRDLRPLLDAMAIQTGTPVDEVENEFCHMCDDADALSACRVRALVVLRMHAEVNDAYFDRLDTMLTKVELTARVYSGTPLDM